MAEREDHDRVTDGNYAVDQGGMPQIGGGGNLGNNLLDLPYATGAPAKGVFDKITDEDSGRRRGMSIMQNQSRKEKRDEAIRREFDRLVDRKG